MGTGMSFGGMTTCRLGRRSRRGLGAGVYPALVDGVTDEKFTGKLRDAESGLDYIGARYMSSAQGRFTSPDPIDIMPQKLLDPQQWNNMYSYVRTSPLRF